MASQTFSQVTPHIARLDLPSGRTSVAVFLVKGEDWTLVDSGPERHTAAVMRAALAHTGGVKPARLILTHGHPGHAGGALKIRAEWRLKVAAGRAEVPYLTEPVFYRKIPGRSLLNYLAGLFILPAMVGRGVDVPLDEGNDLGGMTIYLAPGHAPGMVALLHRADRALLCADAFSSQGGGLGDPAPFLTYDARLNHKSQKKLALLDFDHLIPSHGPALLNDGKRRALAHVESRLGKEALPAGASASAG